MSELRYWMSSMRVAGLIADGRVESATQLRAAIDRQVAGTARANTP
jgi:hypothetical protein